MLDRNIILHNNIMDHVLKSILLSVVPSLPKVPSLLIYEETQYVIDRMDEICRIVFPLSYLIKQAGYWTYYFYIAQDE